MMTKFAMWLYATMGLSILGAVLVGMDMELSRIQIGQLWFGLMTAMWISGVVWFGIEALDQKLKESKKVR